MYVDAGSKFAGEVLTTDEKKLFFCDIGDMLFHYRSGRDKLKNIYVRDYVTGEWIDAVKASYVHSKQFSTPMSWNIAAFSSASEAKKWGTPVDFNGAFGLLR
jgi:nitrous oxide reductase accessory protein NosL